MSTQITVAVGANGEVLNALALRDGARADRLDSEATKKQARQAAIEKLDDDTNGRENKLNKGGVSRDPAAFARKKTDQVKGQFAGLNIQYMHFPLTDENAAQKDGTYMRISFRGIETVEDDFGFVTSSLSPEIVELTLTRNNNVSEFNVERPPGYETTTVWDPRFSLGEFPNNMYFEEWPAYEGHQAYWQEGFNGRSINAHIINDNNSREYFVAIPYASEYKTFSSDRMEAVNGSTSITIWQADLDPASKAFNINRVVNGRGTASDSERFYYDDQYSPYQNSEYDPVEELFLLPYTEDLFFAFVVYTDYNVGSYSGFTVNGTATSTPTDTKYPLANGLGAYFGPATAMETSYTRGGPNYSNGIPAGYEFRSYDLDASLPFIEARPTINDVGANKIQQTYLYKVENGKVTAINVPDELRAFAASLQTDLRNITVPKVNTTNDAQYAGYRQEKYYSERNYWPSTVSTAYLTDGNTSAPPNTALGMYALSDYVESKRKYLNHQQRARSLAKSYGFGRLSTQNHFESIYIETPLQSFFDDNYFTPMVYQYITGMGFPSMNYSQAALGLWTDPETDATFALDAYVDFDGYGKVRSTTGEGKPVRVDQSYQNDYTEWVDAPQLKNATHRCWNWNRPDMCWDKLRELGLPVSVLGTRPPKPNE